MKARGMSRSRVEKLAGLGVGTLARLQSGKGGMTVKTLDKIAKVFGVHPAVFLD